MALEKLVRDRIPGLFKLGKSEYRDADESEMVSLLTKKLAEEVDEFAEAVNANNQEAMREELGDVYDVFHEILFRLGMARVLLKAEIKREERGGFRKRIVLQLKPAVPAILNCPKCGGQHVDHGIWATTRIHRTHLCEHCGHTWRPFDYATVGVEALP